MSATFTLFLWLRRLLVVGAIVIVTLVVGRAFQARSLPDLKRWHTEILRSELTADDLGPQVDWTEYLRREDAVFRELRERVFDRLPAADRLASSRYTKGGPLDPATFARDWNRSYTLEPDDSNLKGGVLLVHGLTDGPYSMRSVAEIFRRRGFYAVVPRMPGHGTAPSGLLEARWEDWMAALRVGVRAVRARIGPTKPLYLVGYSNGGALVTKYSFDALDDPTLARADRVLLLSPMIGVSPFAVAARLMSRLGGIPFFAKSRWLDVYPEYIPFKYNSFPANAGFQTYRLTSALKAEVEAAAAAKRLHELPPILAFQSLVDATVSTPAIVSGLFDHLEGASDELVIFDMNRASGLQPFLSTAADAAMADLLSTHAHRFRVTLITNDAHDPKREMEESLAAGSTHAVERPLDLRWPEYVYSLSHVAIPFPLTDPLFGLTPDTSETYGLRLGLMVPRGERSILMLPPEASTRLFSNPFFPYMEERLDGWIDEGLRSTSH